MDHLLLHDRAIACRVDDFVVRRMGGTIRVLRRARGYAPAPLALPAGFAGAPRVLAMGGELKNSFCLLRDGHAILSHHIGDLENSLTLADYTRAIEQYLGLFGHDAQTVAIDPHPEYLSSKLGIERIERDGGRSSRCSITTRMSRPAWRRTGWRSMRQCSAWRSTGLALAPTQRCGAASSCSPTISAIGAWRASSRSPCRAARGRSGTLAQHLRPYRRRDGMGAFRFTLSPNGTVPVPGGQADRVLDGMIARGVNAPLASSCGRLFDAVAAAAGVCPECAQYEGQAAAEFEALAASGTDDAYRFALVAEAGMLVIEPRPMWLALLDDIAAAVPVPVLSARFHAGLAIAIDATVAALRQADPEAAATNRIALTGGVFQNRILLEQVIERLAARGLTVLTHRDIPANDGGLALGQAAVAAARSVA